LATVDQANSIYCQKFTHTPAQKKMSGRSIVSAIGHPTEKISEFIDLHVRQ
jgi:hypothetical protein